MVGAGVGSALQAVASIHTSKAQINMRFIGIKYIWKKLSNAEFYATLPP